MTTPLTRTMGPPAKPIGLPIDWLAIEGRLGFAPPDDYKRFADTFGRGIIDDFLWVYFPDDHPYVGLEAGGRRALEALDELSRGGTERVPYPLFPLPGGILPWGGTDNGDVCYWRCAGPADSWTVVVNEARGPRWYEYCGGLAAFLQEVLSGSIRVSVFPEDFPSSNPHFEPK
jgi:hypothetical protein